MDMHVYIYKHTYTIHTYTVLIILKEIIKDESFFILITGTSPLNLYGTVYV